MRLVAVKLAYRGAGFHGFQRQPGLPTVENAILEALGSRGCLDPSSPQKHMYSAAGRTDRNAHALGQTISFITSCSGPEAVKAINEHLYPRIAAWAFRENPHGEFKAREWCLARIYGFLLDIPVPTGCRAILEGFKGTRDYSWLVPIDPWRNPRRRVFSVSVAETMHGVLAVITGESFLRQQVRRMVSHALGLCPSRDRCRLLPASRLVLIDTLYSFSFKIIGEAWDTLKTVSRGISSLEASLRILSSRLSPSYEPRRKREYEPSVVQDTEAPFLHDLGFAKGA